ncbi:hypothetical protein [Oryza sativa Japonica Group]|uniref:Uncharacterized protein n=2 Tax=Oryza TaxID=4527 RepID=Q5JL92_ORYSJ|nr:hypothetical protein [Oryza sativa Japonica Group]
MHYGDCEMRLQRIDIRVHVQDDDVNMFGGWGNSGRITDVGARGPEKGEAGARGFLSPLPVSSNPDSNLSMVQPDEHLGPCSRVVERLG